jgi:hypothetical protein
MSLSIFKKIDDMLNPIMVKELRQTVNSRSISMTILSLLGLQLLLMIMFITQTRKSTLGYGQGFFASVMSVLTIVSLFGICATAAQRFAKERKGEGTDVIHSTAMTPSKIIFGKMASSIALGLFLFSLCLPFLGVSYFMRGVDIATIIFGVALSFTILVPIMQLSILTGAFGNLRLTTSLLGLVVILSFAVLPGLLFHGGGLFSGLNNIWTILAWTLYASAALTGFAFFSSVALLAPKHSNRAMPLRIFMAGYWLVSLIIGFAANAWYGTPAFLVVFHAPSVILFSIYAALAVGERDKQTRRVLNHTPKLKILRLPYYLLSTGRANGLLFSAFFLALTTLVSILPIFNPGFHSDFDGAMMAGLAMVAVLLLMYGVLTHFAALTVKRWIPRFNAYVPWFFCLIFFNMGPMIVSVLTKFRMPRSTEPEMLLFTFSPIILDSNTYRAVGLEISAAVTLVLLICLAISEVHSARKERETTRR